VKRLHLNMILLCLVAASVGFLGGAACAQENVPRIIKEDLKPLIGDPNVIVIDVRATGDWEKDTLMIKGAVREDPMSAAAWMDKYPKEKSLVFYCA
jgi:rhodanese-related sulfurtransferase